MFLQGLFFKIYKEIWKQFFKNLLMPCLNLSDPDRYDVLSGVILAGLNLVLVELHFDANCMINKTLSILWKSPFWSLISHHSLNSAPPPEDFYSVNNKNNPPIRPERNRSLFLTVLYCKFSLTLQLLPVLTRITPGTISFFLFPLPVS